MLYPEGRAQCLAILLIGLVGRGWCPALRQLVSHVDYATFYLFYGLASSLVGIMMADLLSQSDDPEDGYRDLFDALSKASRLDRWNLAVFLALSSGACIGFSSFLSGAAIPMAGATRSLPVYNGVALVAGVGLTFAADGNQAPATLFAGMSMVLLAIALTFASRPSAGNTGLTQFTSSGILSYVHLRTLLYSGPGAAIAVDKPAWHPDWESVHVADSPLPTTQSPSLMGKQSAATSSVASPPADLSTCVRDLPGGEVGKGLFFCVLAGGVDGCWPAFALGANQLGLENYLVLFFLSVGLICAVLACETLVWASDPLRFQLALRRLGAHELSGIVVCGLLNIVSLAAFLSATTGLSTSVAVALMSCTPLVSVMIGVRCLCGLVNESTMVKTLVGTILLLYLGAVCLLFWNALEADVEL